MFLLLRRSTGKVQIPHEKVAKKVLFNGLQGTGKLKTRRGVFANAACRDGQHPVPRLKSSPAMPPVGAFSVLFCSVSRVKLKWQEVIVSAAWVANCQV